MAVRLLWLLPLTTAAGSPWWSQSSPVHSAAPVPLICLNSTVQQQVASTGLLSVKLLGAVGDGIADDAPAARAAFNLTLTCGGCVFFPPGTYRFNSTVAIWGCVRGSRASARAWTEAPSPRWPSEGRGQASGRRW